MDSIIWVFSGPGQVVLHSLLIIYFCISDRIPSVPSVLVKDICISTYKPCMYLDNIGNI